MFRIWLTSLMAREYKYIVTDKSCRYAVSDARCKKTCHFYHDAEKCKAAVETNDDKYGPYTFLIERMHVNDVDPKSRTKKGYTKLPGRKPQCAMLVTYDAHYCSGWHKGDKCVGGITRKHVKNQLGERLADTIKGKKEEIAQTHQSIEATEKQREKEGKKNQAQIVDMTKNIEALKGAIVVLKKHQATAFPQVRLNFLSVKTQSKHAGRPQDDLDRLSAWMTEHSYSALTEASNADIEKAVSKFVNDKSPQVAASLSTYSAEELSLLARAKKLVNSFTQTQYAPYANQSGEIFGILTQLLEEMRGDLKDTEDTEAKAPAVAANLLVELKTQLAEAEKMLMDKEMEAAKNVKALADAKEGIEDANTSLDADSKFLKEVIDMCGKADEMREARKKTREEEIAAISQALSMLTGDDARDMFTSTYSFLQMRAVSRRLTSRDRAAGILHAAGAKHHDAALLALSASVHLDGFEKVKKAINDMVADLKQQQADEVKHKDWCNEELHTNDMNTMEKTNEKKDLETKIDSLTSQIDTLVTEIKTAKASLAQTKVELQRANQDRVEENKAFQATIDEQRATQKLLRKVQDRLNEFYAEKAGFLQAKQHVLQKQPVPPVQFGDYKKSGGASPVITMIGNLIADAAALEKEAISDENSAQQAYEEYNAEANESMAALARSIVNKSELKATAETELEQANTDLTQANADLEELSKYAGDVHKACDFVLKNFDIRQTARGEEIEALGQALAILSGMA